MVFGINYLSKVLQVLLLSIKNVHFCPRCG